MPDYNAMSTPALRLALRHNGLRQQLGKKLAAQLLRDIYERTHPIAGSSVDDSSHATTTTTPATTLPLRRAGSDPETPAAKLCAKSAVSARQRKAAVQAAEAEESVAAQNDEDDAGIDAGVDNVDDLLVNSPLIKRTKVANFAAIV